MVITSTSVCADEGPFWQRLFVQALGSLAFATACHRLPMTCHRLPTICLGLPRPDNKSGPETLCIAVLFLCERTLARNDRRSRVFANRSNLGMHRRCRSSMSRATRPSDDSSCKQAAVTDVPRHRAVVADDLEMSMWKVKTERGRLEVQARCEATEKFRGRFRTTGRNLTPPATNCHIPLRCKETAMVPARLMISERNLLLTVTIFVTMVS